MREKLLKVLNDALPGINLEASNSLVDDGILDSLAITIIIAEISMSFGVDVMFEDLESKNFNSLDEIIALIERSPKREGF